MKLKKMDYSFSVCKVKDYSMVDLESEYCFIGKTDEEKSLVCFTESVPNNVISCDNNWRAFRIEGTLDFSLIGILSEISSLLAENNIGIFAVSTFNTDYFFVKEKDFQKALNVLSVNRYEFL